MKKFQKKIDVATTTGWSDFQDWATAVDPTVSPALYDFGEDAFTEEPAEVAKELRKALVSDPPPAPVASVAKGLLAVLDGSASDGVLVISDDTSDVETGDDDGSPPQP